MWSAGKIKSAYTVHNKPQLIKGGSQYFTLLLNLIESAKISIQLQTYIFEEDETGNLVGKAIIKAAQRGIKVQILLDGYASRKLSKVFIAELKSSGIQLRFFEPIFSGGSYYFGRRLHHKVVVVDGFTALVGGINISDRYNDLPGEPAWLDWALLVEGDVAFELHRLCNNFYTKGWGEGIVLDKNSNLNAVDEKSNCPIRVRRNDWVMRRNQISATYMEMLKNAKEEIVIMSSYFIPSRFFRKSISAARKRGVRVQLILASLSDVGIAKNAERHLYRWAVLQGVEIYEYKTQVLHGKVALCDGKFMTIGSYNVNDISAMASIELNLDVDSVEFVGSVKKIFDTIIQKECYRVDEYLVLHGYSLFERTKQRMAYILFRFIFRLFTFYFQKKENKHR